MRRNDRKVTNLNDIISIIEKSKILHLGLFDDVYPYIVPLHYGYEMSCGKPVFFMHSAHEGHKLNLIKNNPNVCVELECSVELISGGDVPCKYGASFSSLICRGKAEIVSDMQEKIKGLKLLMKNQTGNDFKIDDKMASSVKVIKVTVSEFTAKANL